MLSAPMPPNTVQVSELQVHYPTDRADFVAASVAELLPPGWVPHNPGAGARFGLRWSAVDLRRRSVYEGSLLYCIVLYFMERQLKPQG